MITDDKLLEDDDLLLSSPKLSLAPHDSEERSVISQWKVSPQSKKEEKGPSWDDYVVDSILGEGAYGKVYKVHKKEEMVEDGRKEPAEEKGRKEARKKSTKSSLGFCSTTQLIESKPQKKGYTNNKDRKKTEFVIKELFTDQMPKGVALQAMEEISILGSLNSPYIVQYIDSFVSDTKVNIIMEYCACGDLQTYILNKAQSKHPQLAENTIWKYFIHICLGVHYLHSKYILHRDLKSLNIFMCKENTVKIGDLGVARKLQEHSNMSSPATMKFIRKNSESIGIEQTTQVGTPFYLAPEIWVGSQYTDKSDIWSLGVILYELCTFQKPYLASNVDELKQKVLHEKPNLAFPPSTNKDLIDLVNRMLRKDADKRPSIDEILQNQTLKSKAKFFKIQLPSSGSQTSVTGTQNYQSLQSKLNSISNKSEDNPLKMSGSRSSQKFLNTQRPPISTRSSVKKSTREDDHPLPPKMDVSPNKKILKNYKVRAQLEQDQRGSVENATSKFRKSDHPLLSTRQSLQQVNSNTSFNSNQSNASQKQLSKLSNSKLSSLKKGFHNHQRLPTATTSNTVNHSYQCNTIQELIQKEEQSTQEEGPFVRAQTQREKLQEIQEPLKLKKQHTAYEKRSNDTHLITRQSNLNSGDKKDLPPSKIPHSQGLVRKSTIVKGDLMKQKQTELANKLKQINNRKAESNRTSLKNSMIERPSNKLMEKKPLRLNQVDKESQQSSAKKQSVNKTAFMFRKPLNLRSTNQVKPKINTETTTNTSKYSTNNQNKGLKGRQINPTMSYGKLPLLKDPLLDIGDRSYPEPQKTGDAKRQMEFEFYEDLLRDENAMLLDEDDTMVGDQRSLQDSRRLVKAQGPFSSNGDQNNNNFLAGLLNEEADQDVEMTFTDGQCHEDFELQAVREEARIMVERERAISHYQAHRQGPLL